MRFEQITIENFRNFEHIDIFISNKNIFFGLNDVGKTNFLYAFRFVFDKNIRRLNLMDTDFHNKDTSKPIEILVKIDISDKSCTDNQKLRAQLKGALLSEHNKVYIKLVANYDSSELIGIPTLFWGGDIENLNQMKQQGNIYEIDRVINTIYIDSYIDLNYLFKRNINALVNKRDTDSGILEKIKETTDTLNSHISSLKGIKSLESEMTAKYKEFGNKDTSVSIKSEIAVSNIYSSIVPYIKSDENNVLYPTSGDGRKKLLAYSIYGIVSEESSIKKINIFLVEEPENNLHKSLQISLSKILFDDEKYKYMFVSTHSPYVLYDMDDVNLVRIFNKNKIDSASVFYSVPKEFEKFKKALNRNLSEAIFADRVLLIEGPSEQVLFEKILSSVKPNYEATGTYLLSVNGIGFKQYYTILNKLGILTVIKTDNDLRKNKDVFSVLGFSRVNKYLKEEDYLPTDSIKECSVESKRKLYTSNLALLNSIRDKYKVYLSKCDLENDLDEVIHSELTKYLDNATPVDYLQDKKLYHMVELIDKLTEEDCKKIFEDYNFACLKEVII